MSYNTLMLPKPTISGEELDILLLLQVEGVSGIIPSPASFDPIQICQKFVKYLVPLGVRVIFDRWDPTQFPNSRGTIAYYYSNFSDEQGAGHSKIVCAGKLERANWLRYLFFIMHGAGHGKQAHQHLDPSLQAAVDVASNRVPRTSLETPWGTGQFGDYFTGFEAQASRNGWEVLKKFLTEEGISAVAREDCYFLLSLYALADHPYHRKSISAVTNFSNTPREWLAEFGCSFDALLTPYLLSVSNEIEPTDEGKKRVADFQLLIAGTDGRLRSPTHPQLLAIAHLYDLWKEGRIAAF